MAPGASTPLRGALLVAGTTSDAGKSTLVMGLCRLLARRGISVAPFKAQNMSNNSVVTLDGGEIGRAQAAQAAAAGLEPSVRFNPVLLKPGGDRSSQLVVRGVAAGEVTAANYHRRRSELAEVVGEELAALRGEYDVVLCEGAGSLAEINLRESDLANLGLAERADLPAIVVGDIDRGGVLAHFFGTTAILGAADQSRIAGYVVNKFRGDPALLAPGLASLEELTGRPTLGVLPFLDGVWLDAEDSLSVNAGVPLGNPRSPAGGAWLRVAAVRLPRISNSTDLEALACEPGVLVRWASTPADVAEADLVVLPGSKATVADLRWLRERGLDAAIAAHAAAGRAVLGICGGFQMLGLSIDDPLESEAGVVAGLGLLGTRVQFEAPKVLARVSGIWAPGNPIPVSGYEIHHGRVTDNPHPPLVNTEHGPEGAVGGSSHNVLGTHWHGLLAGDGVRREFLRAAARHAGRADWDTQGHTNFAALRAAGWDAVADACEEHLDMPALERIISEGVDPALPTLRVTKG